MTQEAKERSPQSVNFNELVARAPEYDRYSTDDSESARFMVVRMFYFVEATSPDPQHDWQLPQIGASMVTGDYDKAISEAQRLYAEYYLKGNPEEPASILEKLIPIASEYSQIPRGRRLVTLKRVLGGTHSPTPELVAERRMMRRKAWELQLTNIDNKLKAGDLPPRKEKGLRKDQYKLTDLLLHHRSR